MSSSRDNKLGMSEKTVLLPLETLKMYINGVMVGDEINSKIVLMVLSTVLTKFCQTGVRRLLSRKETKLDVVVPESKNEQLGTVFVVKLGTFPETILGCGLGMELGLQLGFGLGM